jgi:hypothetical protein
MRRVLLTCFVSVTLLSGCWEPTEVTVLRVVPNVIALPGVELLAIGEITGPGGDTAAHLLAESLMQLGQFSVLDWSAPFALGQSKDGWAERHGGWRTADATLMGSMQSPVVQAYWDSRSARATDGSEVTTYARTVELAQTGHFRVLDPRNGLIMSSTTATGRAAAPTEYVTLTGGPTQDPAYLDSFFAPPPMATLQELATEALVSEITGLIARTYVPTSVTLWHDRRNADLVRALDKAKRGEWHAALEVYEQAILELELHAPSQAYMAHYNYGVALAMSGQLARGIQEVEVALAMKDNTRIRHTLEQLRGYYDASLALQGDAPIKR